MNLPWLRGAVILGEPYPALVAGARKIVQLTGEYDRESWNGSGTPPFAFNRTESQFGIRGCDLGASFESVEQIYFLFGDTWRVNQNPVQLNYDSIAFTTDTDPLQRTASHLPEPAAAAARYQSGCVQCAAGWRQP